MDPVNQRAGLHRHASSFLQFGIDLVGPQLVVRRRDSTVLIALPLLLIIEEIPTRPPSRVLQSRLAA